MKRIKRANFRLHEFIAESLIAAVAFTSFIFIFLILIFVFRESIPLVIGKAVDDVGNVSLRALFSTTAWIPVSNNPRYGIWPLVVGSIKVTLMALVIAFPISVLAAIYTATLAPRRVKEIMKPTIEILAGFPSVVIGFFALMVLASFFQYTLGLKFRLNAFTGGVALSLAVIPIIYTITEETLNSLPKTMTEASLALGATKWETSLFVLLPAATQGVFAAFLLGLGRAFGETMIVLMATGNAALSSWNLFEPVRTMSAAIGAEMAEVVFGDAHYNILFFIGVCLFIFSFSLNAIAEFFLKQRMMKRFKGGA
ncbi:MAG: phosphate ABC transporter permease subunit PstC [Chitinispirillaceae bacterium]|nr:phosphate ABC transporter permease subunit PstC [Chitinispirillaceae bacterium]